MIPILPNNPANNVSNLWVWGSNADYRTGLGTNSGTSNITNINAPIGKDAKKWTVVGKGDPTAEGSIGINNGRLYAWGTLAARNVGIDSAGTVVFQRPTQIHPDTDWIDCAYQSELGSRAYSLFLKSSGMLYQCGVGSGAKFELVSSYPEWDQIDCGNGFQGAIKKNGQLFGWGEDFFDRRTFGGTGSINQAKFINISLGVSEQMLIVKEMSLGFSHGIVVANIPYQEVAGDMRPRNDMMASWGENADGECAQDNTSSPRVFRAIKTETTINPGQESFDRNFYNPIATRDLTVALRITKTTSINQPRESIVYYAGNRASGATNSGSTTGNVDVMTASINNGDLWKIAATYRSVPSTLTLLALTQTGNFFYCGSGDGNPNGGFSTDTFTTVPGVTNTGAIRDIKGGNNCGFLISDENIIP